MSTDTFSAFRNPGVLRFAIGRFLSAVATTSTARALGYQLYESTHSKWAIGLVGLVEVIPVVLLALPAGTVSDRMPRRQVAIAAHILLAASSAGMVALTWFQGPIWVFYVLLFLNGIALAFRGPSVSAMVPQLVPAKDFVSANTWFSSSFELAAAVGPAIGGLLIAVAGNAALTFTVACVGHLAFIGVLMTLPNFPAAMTGKSQGVSDLFAGLRFVFRTKVFLAAITLDMFAVLLGGAVALLPVFAEDVLHVGPVGFGFLGAAPAVGALTMAILHSRFPAWKRPGVVLLVTVIGFGVATVGFGLSTSFWLSLVCLFFVGLFDNVSVVIRATIEQSLTPDVMRGRVSAINQVFIGMSNELGSFESGAAAALFGAIPAVVGGGIGTILVVLAVAGLFRAEKSASVA